MCHGKSAQIPAILRFSKNSRSCNSACGSNPTRRYSTLESATFWLPNWCMVAHEVVHGRIWGLLRFLDVQNPNLPSAFPNLTILIKFLQQMCFVQIREITFVFFYLF